MLVVAENKLLTLEFGLREDALARNLRRLNRRAVVEEGSGSDVETEGSASGSGAPEEVTSGYPDDNEKDGSGCGGEDGSGDGSGCGPVPVVTTRKPTTKPSTKATQSPTIVDINTAQQKTTSAPPSTFAPTTTGNEINPEPVTQDPNNTVGSAGSMVDDAPAASGVDFTSGIIIGVVVGAILAILIILFLVYRIRKKDSGSYILDEKSSQAMLQEEDQKEHGKEYFA